MPFISRLAFLPGLLLITLLGAGPAAAQDHVVEVSSFQIGTVVVWIKATDGGAVLVYASQGFRAAFTRPIELPVAEVTSWADSAAAILAQPEPGSQSLQLGDGSIQLAWRRAPHPVTELSLPRTASGPLLTRLTDNGARQLIAALRDAARTSGEITAALEITMAAPAAPSQAADSASGVPPAKRQDGTARDSTPRDSVARKDGDVRVAASPAYIPIDRVLAGEARPPSAPTITQVLATSVLSEEGGGRIPAAPAPRRSPPLPAEAASVPRVASTQLARVPKADPVAVAPPEPPPMIGASAEAPIAVRDTKLIAARATSVVERRKMPRSTVVLRPSSAVAVASAPPAASPVSARTASATPPIRTEPTAAEAGLILVRSPVAAPLAGEAARDQTRPLARQAQLQFCFREYGLKMFPKLRGTLTVGLSLKEGGEVIGASVKHGKWTESGGKDVEACVVEHMRTWKLYREEVGTGKVTLTYSFSQ